MVALDRIRNKIELIRQNAEMFKLRSVKAFCFNSTKVGSNDIIGDGEGDVITSLPELL